ncbi:MAG: glycoside hydrolase family 2 protein, partial [Omnitrophica WOR_2 bacterium]
MLENELAEILSLDGSWEFSLGDRSHRASIRVPGCWEAQGFSKLIDGPAVYRREVNIPHKWSGKTIQAEFDAMSYACTVSLNGIETGSHRGMWTPFSIDLTQAARPGEQNQLELTVYKPGKHYPMRSSLAGFLPDVATTFGGLWQPARLRLLEYGITDLRVDADVDCRCLRVRCQAVAPAARKVQGEWSIEVHQGEQLIAGRSLKVDTPFLDAQISLDNVILWEPEHPALYTVCVCLLEEGKTAAQVTRRVGFRRLSADGSQLLLNGRPFLIRGILSWGWEPDRIAPAYTPEQARAEMRRVRALGFNMIKLCLFVPNQAYFAAADEEGMLLWEELPLWLPEVTDDLRLNAPEEYAAITRQVQHHPSVVLYSLGCELSKAVDGELLGSLNQAVRDSVSNVLVCDNSGSAESYGGLDFDFSDFSDYHPYYDLQYFEPLLDNWRRDWQAQRPWIFGEFCDSDTFRNLDEIIAANQSAKPWWLTAENPVSTWRPEAQAMLEEQERLSKANLNFSASD